MILFEFLQISLHCKVLRIAITKELGVLSVRYLYKKIFIMSIVKRFRMDNFRKDFCSKRERIQYDFLVKKSYKSFSQFDDYLRPTYFNFMFI